MNEVGGHDLVLGVTKIPLRGPSEASFIFAQMAS